MKTKFEQSDREKMLRRIAQAVKSARDFEIGCQQPAFHEMIRGGASELLKFLQGEIMQTRCDQKNGGFTDDIRDVRPL